MVKLAMHKIIVIAAAAFVTAPLLYYAMHPVHIVHIFMQPKILNGMTLFSNKIITRPDSNGIVFFDMDGYIEDPSIIRIIISIKPCSKPDWYEGNYSKVPRGIFLGTARLGTAQWPVTNDEESEYSYKLVSSDGILLSQGNILARVETVAGGNQLLIVAIGLLASVLQILSLLLFSNK